MSELDYLENKTEAYAQMIEAFMQLDQAFAAFDTAFQIDRMSQRQEFVGRPLAAQYVCGDGY